MIIDYIVDILGDKYVVLLENNRLEKVDTYYYDYIYTTNGSKFFYYPTYILEHWDISMGKTSNWGMKTLDVRFLLWEAKKWKRECYINFILNYDYTGLN